MLSFKFEVKLILRLRKNAFSEAIKTDMFNGFEAGSVDRGIKCKKEVQIFMKP